MERLRNLLRLSPRKQKNISVYIGVAGYSAMLITGDFLVGVWSKLIAEMLRIGFYQETEAPDMVLLSWFFICSSIVIIIQNFLK